MKFNKWTLGLAAVGAVSLASAARADETKMSQVSTAVSGTTISGYVSSSVNWTMSPSDGNVSQSPAGLIPLQSGKANGYNLDVVKVSISKAQDETEWASGYQADLLFGPDAIGWNPTTASGGSSPGSSYSDGQMAIQQAYVALRVPVGHGINWKIGVFNTPIGYESFDAGSNPNYTRSWGFAVEPTEHTGILASYQFNDEFTVQWGTANTLYAGINTRNNYKTGAVNDGAWNKTVMGALTFTAPSDWGWASGSAFYVGAVYGYAGNNNNGTGKQGGNQGNVYAGATLNSPWKNVTFGAAFDYVQNVGGGDTTMSTGSPNYNYSGYHQDDYIFGLYNTIKATEKLSFNSRVEYWDIEVKGQNEFASDTGISLTETVQYDLWANVISRLEFRYDHVMTGTGSEFIGYYTPGGYVGGGFNNSTESSVPSNRTSYGVYANFIYKF